MWPHRAPALPYPASTRFVASKAARERWDTALAQSRTRLFRKSDEVQLGDFPRKNGASRRQYTDAEVLGRLAVRRIAQHWVSTFRYNVRRATVCEMTICHALSQRIRRPAHRRLWRRAACTSKQENRINSAPTGVGFNNCKYAPREDSEHRSIDPDRGRVKSTICNALSRSLAGILGLKTSALLFRGLKLSLYFELCL